VISVLFGVANELSQIVVPYKSASPPDVIANFIGATLAVVLYGKLASRSLPESP
jgi:VanZ family protein